MASGERSVVRWPGPVAVISVAQLLGTSLWFSANGAGPALIKQWDASAADLGQLTSAVQLGFILGTLFISLSGLADRFRASSMFVASCLLGAAFNACFAWLSHGIADASIYRFCVGLALAGIYPIGMKLLVQWAPERAGWALSLLVGMLILGTGLPHALRWLASGWDWRVVASASSMLALGGGILIYLLGDSPSIKSPHRTLVKPAGGWRSVASAFHKPAFRAAAFGYFGHMWELYAFWTVLPLVLDRTVITNSADSNEVSALSFAIIAIGALGCIFGGWVSQRVGSARVAAVCLAGSGISSVAFLLGLDHLSSFWLLSILAVWGALVAADSPHFSALSARACDPENVGTALAFQNSVGFAITVVSISWVTSWFDDFGLKALWLLLAGPVIGLWMFRPLWTRQPTAQTA